MESPVLIKIFDLTFILEGIQTQKPNDPSQYSRSCKGPCLGLARVGSVPESNEHKISPGKTHYAL